MSQNHIEHYAHQPGTTTPCCSQTSSALFSECMYQLQQTLQQTLSFCTCEVHCQPYLPLHTWLQCLHSTLQPAGVGCAHCASESYYNLDSVGRAQAQRNCVSWFNCSRLAQDITSIPVTTSLLHAGTVAQVQLTANAQDAQLPLAGATDAQDHHSSQV